VKFLFIVVTFLCLTLFRPLLLFTYPILVFLFFLLLRLRLNKTVGLACLAIIVAGTISMIIEGFFVYNLVFSLYLIITTLLFATAKPVQRDRFQDKAYFNSFIKIFSYFLVVVNISAAIYAVLVLATADYPEDVFTGLYGKGGFGSHSLSVINFLMATYYFFEKKYKNFAFFFVCGILGFYGQGLFIYVIAFGLVILPYLLKNVATTLKIVFIAVSFFSVVYLINPANFKYIRVNIAYAELIFEEYDYEYEIEKMKDHRRTYIPRYITFLDGSRRLFFSDAKVFFLGTSPGTYNSRVAFYLNGDFIQNKTYKKLFNYQTEYHHDYVLPILNRKYLANTMWNDGTRNQPFSSLVSVLLEYGFIFGSIILFLFFSSIRRVRKATSRRESSNFVKFIFYYCLILFLFQYYLEVIEIVFPMLLMVKLIEVDLLNAKSNQDAPTLES